MNFASPSPKGDSPRVAYPRAFSVIVASVCGLVVVVLAVASLLLVSQPVVSTIRVYFYGTDDLSSFDSFSWGNPTLHGPHNDAFEGRTNIVAQQGEEASENTTFANDTNDIGTTSLGLVNSSDVMQPGLDASSSSPATVNQSGSADSGCDLYHGQWVYDSSGPLYTNNSCPTMPQDHNCQGNGRPDKDYENWRWKPAMCDLPRFDARRFLELMRGKTIAFIGDSLARNQMMSLLCILWQVEVPQKRGKKLHRFYFRSTSTMIVRIWSNRLLHQTSEPFDNVPEGVVKVFLDAPDEGIMEFLPSFDVIVLSSSHWFTKRSVYVLNNEIVGGQLCSPDMSQPMKVNNVEAFGISVETILHAMVTHPNYTGLTILRSYSPDHYQGGAWNTGGSCTGKVRPISDGERVGNGYTNIMHEKQVMGFNRAARKRTNKSKLKLMDITEAFTYRHDGHPGPYRDPELNKKTKGGKPQLQDCLHWCMPGPVDTWNELMLEIIRREFESPRS